MIKIVFGISGLVALYFLIKSAFAPVVVALQLDTDPVTPLIGSQSVESLQRLIASGEDPTEVLPAAAAGLGSLEFSNMMHCKVGFIESQNDLRLNGASAVLLAYPTQDHLYVFIDDEIIHLARSGKGCYTRLNSVDEAFHTAVKQLQRCSYTDTALPCIH